MHIISVVGYSNSGKTTLIECLLRELKTSGYSVGIVKNIHCEKYNIDKRGKDTYRYKMVGADIVTGYGPNSTDIMIQKKIDLQKLIGIYEVDYLFLEGVLEQEFPRIVTAKDIEDVEIFLNNNVLFVSGVISEVSVNYKSYKVLNPNRDIAQILKMIENSKETECDLN